MKALTKISIGFLALAAVALWFTSCSSEDVAQNGGSQSDKESLLTLTINTGKIMGSRTTDWTSDPAGANESKISAITIGIFDGATKNVKAIIVPTKGDDDTDPGDNKFTYSTTTQKITAKVIAKALSANDDVLVAVNPAGKDKFASVSDENSFNAVTESLSEALGTGTSQDNTNIPMYGTGKLVAASSTNTNSFKADNIVVKRLLAKITLDNLSVDFKGIYAGAEFKPTCCFLINVPENLKFADGKDSWNTSAALYSGWASYDSSTGFDYTTQNSGIVGTFNEFLTTKDLPGATPALKGTDVYGGSSSPSKVYFYTMPNGNDKASAKNTKLVIAGKFKANSSAQEQMVYYPVPLNVNIAAGGTETPGLDDKYKVYPNKNYICNVTIKTIGVANPNLNLDPQDATITIKVENWTSVNQTTIFD